MSLIRILPLFVCCVYFVAADKVNFNYCDSDGATECPITDVDITPCPEGPSGNPCRLKRGKSATLSFKYQPNWEAGAGKLKTRAYWASYVDLPFLGMDTDLCKYSTCPLKKGQVTPYNYTLELAKNYLAQSYVIKFKIWEEDSEPEKECCLLVNLKLY